MLTLTDWAYLAGLFDGEGCIQILRQQVRKNGGRTRPFYLMISIRNTDTKVMEWVLANFGGHLHDCNPTSPTAQRSWNWTISSTKALTILKGIQPHLIIKAEQCAVAIEFQEHVSLYMRSPYKRVGIGRGRPIVPPDLLEYRLGLFTKLKALRADRKRYEKSHLPTHT